MDFCVATHHGLIGGYKKPNEITSHFRKELMLDGDINYYNEQYSINDGLSNNLINRIQKYELRMSKFDKKEPLFYEGTATISRAMLIMADHVVSTYSKPGKYELYANTLDDSSLNQDLNYHLQTVGETASFYMFSLFNNLSLPPLSPQTITNILTPSFNPKFEWQDVGAKETYKLSDKRGSLIFNCADTGMGKTKSNLKIAASLSPNPRVTIVLNLRSLTLQTGTAYKKELKPNELSVVQGNKYVETLYNKDLQNKEMDTDGNTFQEEYDIAFEYDTIIPQWMESFCSMKTERKKLLSPPVLVSTIDYIINAGNPDKQGNHVASLLRIASSDLILDEVDSYEPNQLTAICHCIELAAMFNRNVICSSATINIKTATMIYIAYNRGKQINSSFYNRTDNVNIAFIDNSQKNIIGECNNKDAFKNMFNEFVTGKYANYDTTITPRLANIIDSGNTIEQLYHNINSQILNFHESFKCTIYDKTISLGLIRISNITPAIELARFLSTQKNTDICYKICCYHSNHTLIQRHAIEKQLDLILNKNTDDWKDHIYQHTKDISHTNICFIVIATPVEEIGRDHQFEWGIFEPSSMQSLVQVSGRIQRHTNTHTNIPNIAILNRNINDINNKNFIFIQPGYQIADQYNQKTHTKTQMLDLLKTKHNTNIKYGSPIQIYSGLRNSTDPCEFSIEDDKSIGYQLIEPYTVFFEKFKTVDKYQFNKYILREKSHNINIIWYHTENDELSYKLKLFNLNTKNHPDRNDMVYVDARVKTDWLVLTYTQSKELCKQYKIPLSEGLTVSILGNNADEYCHDYSFGFYKLKAEDY